MATHIETALIPLAAIHFDGLSLLGLLPFLVIFYILLSIRDKGLQPSIRFSTLDLIKKGQEDKKFTLFDQRALLILLTMLTGSAALLNIRLEHDVEGSAANLPREGVALYLVLDRSGSMNEMVPTNRGVQVSRMDELKRVTKEFIKGHDNDLLGLVAFARKPDILVPLTLERAPLYQAIDQLHVVLDRKREDGTQIGYAIYKTAHLIDAVNELQKNRGSYDIKHSAIILVTDGLQTTHPDDINDPYRSIGLDDAAEYAKSVGVRLYIVNITPEIERPEFAPQQRQLQRVTEITGGRFFVVSSPYLLDKIYDEIGSIEKSQIPLKGAVKEVYKYLYPTLIAFSLLFLIIFLLFEYKFNLRIP